MQDQTIINRTKRSEDEEYVCECIKEVCIEGDSLSKYQRIIEKKFGPEFYQKCDGFVQEVRRSIDRRKFTNTSITNLRYLANEIHLPVETVDSVMSHFSEEFEEERQREEDAARRREEEERLRQQRLAEEAERARKKEQLQKAWSITKKVLPWAAGVIAIVVIIVTGLWKWILGILFIIGLIAVIRNKG